MGLPTHLRVVHVAPSQNRLALGQAIYRHPHPTRFQLKKFRVGQVNKGQHVVAKATMDLGHVRIQVAIKIGIKLHRVQQGVRGQMLVVSGDLGKQADRKNHLMRHVQADHGQLPACREHQVGGVRVVPDVGLGHRRYIAGLQHGAAHQNHFAHQTGQFRRQLQGHGQVAQRSHRHQSDLTRIGARHVDDKLGRGTRVQRVRGVMSRDQIAQPVIAMDEVGRRLGGLDPGFGNALGHRHLYTRNGRQVQRVGRGLLHRDIAKGGGDADHIDLRMGQRVIQRHGVVHAGVGIKNDFAGCVGHRGFQFRPHRARRATRREGVLLSVCWTSRLATSVASGILDCAPRRVQARAPAAQA